MASTTTNGVVLEVPYGIIKVFRDVRPFSCAVVGRTGITRTIVKDVRTANLGIFVYNGDSILFELQAPANADNVPVFNIVQVNPSTGVETTQAVVTMTAFWQKRLKLAITGINASSGLVSFTTNHS